MTNPIEERTVPQGGENPWIRLEHLINDNARQVHELDAKLTRWMVGSVNLETNERTKGFIEQLEDLQRRITVLEAGKSWAQTIASNIVVAIISSVLSAAAVATLIKGVK